MSETQGPTLAKILVIEDDTAVRSLILRALRDGNYAVTGAENGVEGIEIARSWLPDLVLCDVRMEKLDGYGTLEALRKHTATTTTPFILMTGQADHASMRQGMELGADDYLPKPFTVMELLAAVEARLRSHQAMRRQAEARLQNLRTNISCALPHELRTPLNGILGFSELLMQEGDSLRGDEVMTMGRAIHDSARRLHRVIENTLLYAQIELAWGDDAKVAALRKGYAENIEPAVRKASMRRAFSDQREADLKLTLAAAAAAMSEEHLTRVVDELVENAFKFSNPGSPVTVSLAPEESRVVLEVSDQGRGMRQEDIQQMGAYMQFDRRFYEQQGSGLGLTIAKRLVELHGGTMMIQSELGRGTQVFVRLPSKSSEAV